MDILKKILSFFIGKQEKSSTLLNVGDEESHTTDNRKEMSDINIHNNSGNVKISGRDIK